MARAYRSTAARRCRSTSLARGMLRCKPSSSLANHLTVERPQGIRKATPIRRSARLQQRHTPQSAQVFLIAQDNNGADVQVSLTSLPYRALSLWDHSCNLTRSHSPQARSANVLVRRIRQINPYRSDSDRLQPQRRTHKDTASDGVDSNDPVDHWRKHRHWPRKYFESEGDMSHLLARKKSTSSLRRKSSAASISSSGTTPTPSDQKPREAKSAQYRDARYETLLEAKNSFFDEYELGISDETKKLCRKVFNTEQNVPDDSLFSDDLYERTCKMIRKRNETRLMRDITSLIVPSAEILAIRGSRHLEVLVETA